MNIEERLTRLESLVGSQNEALTPNYLTYDPITGQVGASFSGTVNAQGVTIPASPVAIAPGATNRIQWVRASDGAQVAQMWASAFGPAGTQSDTLLIEATAPENTDAAGVVLRTRDPFGAVRAAINISQQAGVAGSGRVKINNSLLLDEVGGSDWLQVVLAQRGLKLDTGTDSLTFTGATNSNNTVTSHGLGKTPVVVFLTSLAAPGFGQIPTLNAFALTNTNFTVNGETKNAWAGTTSYSWLALG